MKRHEMKNRSTGCFAACFAAVALLFCLPVVQGAEVALWEVFETSYESAKAYPNAFTEVEVDVVFEQGEKQWKVPAFWAGDKKTYHTATVKVGNVKEGKTGLWSFQIGERQEFGRFAVSATPFDPPKGPVEVGLPGVLRTGEYHALNLPSPQDWVLVLERLKP